MYTNERLLKDLTIAEENDFKNDFNYMKIDITKFEELLQLVNPLIKKKDKVMREATST